MPFRSPATFSKGEIERAIYLRLDANMHQLSTGTSKNCNHPGRAETADFPPGAAVHTSAVQASRSCRSARERRGTRQNADLLHQGAGHWVQQEQPERVSDLLIDFLREQAKHLTAA
jgi:hypothetical protein